MTSSTGSQALDIVMTGRDDVVRTFGRRRLPGRRPRATTGSKAERVTTPSTPARATTSSTAARDGTSWWPGRRRRPARARRRARLGRLRVRPQGRRASRRPRDDRHRGRRTPGATTAAAALPAGSARDQALSAVGADRAVLQRPARLHGPAARGRRARRSARPRARGRGQARARRAADPVPAGPVDVRVVTPADRVSRAGCSSKRVREALRDAGPPRPPTA